MSAIAVTGIEALTPVGRSFVETGAALRARVGGIVEHPALLLCGRDPAWDPPAPVRIGLVSALDPLLPLEDRLLELGRGAFQGLVTAAALGRREVARAALLLACPEPEPSADGAFDALARALGGAAGLAAPLERVPAGHLALARAVTRAGELLAARAAERVVVLLVDSFADAGRVDAWNDAYRLRSPKNPDGFLPGEAAVALLLEPLERGAAPSGRGVLGSISAPSYAEEPAPLAAERASTGAGLAAALGAQGGDRAWIVSDLNGESYGAHEWAVVRARLAEALAGLRAFHHPLESTGDVGAAAGGLLVAHALHAFARRSAPAREALCFAAAGGAARAAWRVIAP